MDMIQENKSKLEALKKEVSAAENAINAEIARAARESREIDPRLYKAIDKVEKTKQLIITLSETLVSMNKLFKREVE